MGSAAWRPGRISTRGIVQGPVTVPLFRIALPPCAMRTLRGPAPVVLSSKDRDFLQGQAASTIVQGMTLTVPPNTPDFDASSQYRMAAGNKQRAQVAVWAKGGPPTTIDVGEIGDVWVSVPEGSPATLHIKDGNGWVLSPSSLLEEAQKLRIIWKHTVIKTHISTESRRFATYQYCPEPEYKPLSNGTYSTVARPVGAALCNVLLLVLIGSSSTSPSISPIANHLNVLTSGRNSKPLVFLNVAALLAAVYIVYTAISPKVCAADYKVKEISTRFGSNVAFQRALIRVKPWMDDADAKE
ncbi:hypothetical protein K466DRAFT_571040 [Polyporus arcularius HHB13444]|uniref:Uncharacterized protein n=1 Tax=Polyporus arcularius HHB13444 TaxID=1314778 RepID=A0A5C3NN76_9APHY|nr:hypothetical protein K466DRAFT_571040 [Polyporus arcularius HHB13444]